MLEVKCLSDDKLQNELDKLGFSPGPVLRMYVAITRDRSMITCELTPKAENYL